MELDELKKIWNESPVKNKSNVTIMEQIHQKNYGPLASLKKSYQRQMLAMAIVPFVLVLLNLEQVDKLLGNVLFWSYVAFCIGMVVFSTYNYNIVKNLQAMDASVKNNLNQQVILLEKRAKLELAGFRGILLFLILLVEVVPYFQHYHLLDRWHSVFIVVRIGVYGLLLFLQWVISRRMMERKVGTHLAELKHLANQMD